MAARKITKKEVELKQRLLELHLERNAVLKELRALNSRYNDVVRTRNFTVKQSRALETAKVLNGIVEDPSWKRIGFTSLEHVRKATMEEAVIRMQTTYPELRLSYRKAMELVHIVNAKLGHDLGVEKEC